MSQREAALGLYTLTVPLHSDRQEIPDVITWTLHYILNNHDNYKQTHKHNLLLLQWAISELREVLDEVLLFDVRLRRKCTHSTVGFPLFSQTATVNSNEEMRAGAPHNIETVVLRVGFGGTPNSLTVCQRRVAGKPGLGLWVTVKLILYVKSENEVT